MKPSSEASAMDHPGVTRWDPAPAMTSVEELDHRSEVCSVTRETDDCFCEECGQILAGRTAVRTQMEAVHPWWAWGLIALGAALTILFGLTASFHAREWAATEDILRGRPAAEVRLEGPSIRLAAVRSAVPLDVLDRYIAAEQPFKRALGEAGFGLATLLLGASVFARRSAQRSRISPSVLAKPHAPLDPVYSALFEGWALVETVGLATFRLLTVTFLYLLSARAVAGEPPTLAVLQETLDRVIEIMTKLPELAR